jgi:small subunit ribosomal protein S1
MQVGDGIQAVATRIEPYGVWLESQGIVGLMLITDISHRVVRHPSEYAEVGQEITVKILRFNDQNGNFVASRKELHPEEML